LTKDACSRLPIIIKSHNLHVGNIRRVVGGPTMRRTNFILFFGFCELFIFWPFSGLPFFFSLVMVPTIIILLDFCDEFIKQKA